MQDTKLRFRNIFMSVYILAIIALLVLPMLKYSVKYIPIVLFTVPFVAVYTVQKRKSAIVFLCFILMLALLFIFSFLINAPLNVSAAINLSIILYFCFIPFFIFDYLSNHQNIWEIRIVLIGIAVIFLYIIFMTSREFADNPVIARTLATGSIEDEYINEMRMKNVGGFGFAYAVGMFIPYVAIRIVRAKGSERILPIVVYILLLVFALYCQYTTLLLFAITFSIIVFIAGSKSVFTKSILIFAALLIVVNISGIFKFLGNNLPLTSLAYHFKNLYISINTGEETTSRLLAMRRCYSMFRKAPFFGGNILDPYNHYVIASGHSTYFPILASNGIVGLSILFLTTALIIASIYSKVNRVSKNINKQSMIAIIYIMYFLLGFFNPTHNAYEISVIIFIFIPLIEIYESIDGSRRELITFKGE